ncbi:MAG: VWA domain-containing protein [Planctomycetota bacterium]
MRRVDRIGLALLLTAALAAPGAAQQDIWSTSESNVVVPQVRSFVIRPDAGRVHVTGIDVDVEILRQVATTTLDIALRNPGGVVEEASLLLPVPDHSVVRGFDFEGASAEPTARLLPAEEARGTYASIVSRSKDPALLEFAGHRTVRSSVFPVPAGGTQTVRLVYEHVLPGDGERVDYVLPRSEAIAEAPVPWELDLHLVSDAPISTLYSPSHAITETRVSPSEIRVHLGGKEAQEAGAFQLSYLLEGAGVTASVFAFPDARVGGGYFLLLAGLPVTLPEASERQQRELILALDTSGSMRGQKFEQARGAARAVLGGLEDGERFNIVDYASGVHSFAPGPVVKSATTLAEAYGYLDRLEATGGTALESALRETLQQVHDTEMLPLVLFLTDGLPTSGITDEATIRENAVEYNAHDRRIFTFGVGDDVNAPLLDRLADETRATSEYVRPNEDIEVAVSNVFDRLYGPVLSAPELTFHDPKGVPTTSLIRETLPAALPDLYEGDQLIVLGKYTSESPAVFKLVGSWFGEEKTFAFQFDFSRASNHHAFVPRLWADRRIGTLIDDIRQSGADASGTSQALLADPRAKEMMEEILRLSTEYGILTEYTSFLALEGTDLTAPKAVLVQLDGNLNSRARSVRAGRGAINQSLNLTTARARAQRNRANTFFDVNLEEVRESRVVQVGERSFFKRSGVWVDSRLLRVKPKLKEMQFVHAGTPEHLKLVQRLVETREQSLFALRGQVLTQVDGKPIMILGAKKPTAHEGGEPAKGI